MRTSIVIEKELLKKLIVIGGFRTKREAIQTAIEQFIARAEANALADMAGLVEFENGHIHTITKLEEEEP